MTTRPLPLPVALVLVPAVLGAGAYLVAVLRTAIGGWLAGRPPMAVAAAVTPLHEARWLWRQQVVTTERPDALLGWLAPAAYLGLAAAALSVVPLGPGLAVADVGTGIVVFGAAEALAIVVLFLRGWAPNSGFPLVAGFGFVGVALSYELLSMFVLIAAALPAGSLSVGAIVGSQEDLWNVVRQPLGLPLWLVVTLGVTFSGPLDLLAPADLAGGGAAEDSGTRRLLWAGGRAAMTVVFAAAGAAVFLGGWNGPVLPGAAWMALKTVAIVAVLVGLGQAVARISAERFVSLAWSVLLPLAFLHLVLAGLEAL